MNSINFYEPSRSIATTVEQPAAVGQSSLPIEPTMLSLERIVFYENDQAESPDYSDEEDDNEEIVDDNIGFTLSPTLDEAEENVENLEDELIRESGFRGEFFPFKDKILQTMYQFYYRIGNDISQALMKEIVKLVNDVANAKAEYPGAKVPIADLLFNFDNKKRTNNKIPVLRQTVHEVLIKKQDDDQEVDQTRSFHMNPPSEILKLLVATPLTTDRITALPDDTEGELVESCQSNKWKHHEMFQHPMVSVNTNGLIKDYWVGDLIKKAEMMLVTNRFFTLNLTTIMGDGYEVVQQKEEGAF